MKLEGSVVLVIGADTALGAAVVRALLSRSVSKVYADAPLERCEVSVSYEVPMFVEIGKQSRAATLARELTDVTLLIHCLVADHSISWPGEGRDQRSLQPQGPTVGRTLNLIDAFAPILSANGGGTVVNILCALQPDPLSEGSPQTKSRPFAEWILADGLAERLAAQQTKLLFFGTQLAIGLGIHALDEQRALAAHVAMRLLLQLDVGDWASEGESVERLLPISPLHRCPPMLKGKP